MLVNHSRIGRVKMESGMTYREFAAAVRMSLTAVRNIQKGVRKVWAEELYRIAKFSGKPMDWFFERDD